MEKEEEEEEEEEKGEEEEKAYLSMVHDEQLVAARGKMERTRIRGKEGSHKLCS